MVNNSLLHWAAVVVSHCIRQGIKGIPYRLALVLAFGNIHSCFPDACELAEPYLVPIFGLLFRALVVGDYIRLAAGDV